MFKNKYTRLISENFTPDDTYTKNFDGRNLYLTTSITAESVQPIIKAIHDINESDDYIFRSYEISNATYNAAPINLYINSPGGEVMATLSLITAIETSETPIHTHCIGEASSGALFIYVTGHKRYAYKHSIFMYHQLSSGALGTFKDIQETVEVLNHLQDRLEELFLYYTKFTKEELEQIKLHKKDYTFYYDEALEKGMIDELVISETYKNDIDKVSEKYKNSKTKDDDIEEIVNSLSEEELEKAILQYVEKNKNNIT